MKKTLLMATTTAALFPLFGEAIADTHTSEENGSDLYVGISVGKGKQNLNLSAAAAATHDPDVTTLSFFMGMDLNATFAIEGFYANHGKSEFSGSTDTVKLSTMGIAAKAGTSLTDDFRAFVKVGYHSWKSESGTNDDGTDVLYGIGGEYNLSETTAVVVGYDRLTYGKSNVTDMSVGIKYRF